MRNSAAKRKKERKGEGEGNLRSVWPLIHWPSGSRIFRICYLPCFTTPIANKAKFQKKKLQKICGCLIFRHFLGEGTLSPIENSFSEGLKERKPSVVVWFSHAKNPPTSCSPPHSSYKTRRRRRLQSDARGLEKGGVLLRFPTLL